MTMSPSRRKLRKLITDPRTFFQDSRIARVAFRVVGRELDKTIRGLSVDEHSDDTTSRQRRLTIDDIKASIADTALSFFIDGDATDYPIACCLARDWSELIESTLECCRKHSLLIALWDETEFIVPSSTRIAMSFLRARNRCLLRLSDKRSLDVFYIEIQAWRTLSDHIMAPCPNILSQKVWQRCLDAHNLPRRGEVAHLNEILSAPLEQDIPFDVDFVYTWVNSDDPGWQKLYATHKPGESSDGNSLSRFYNRNELMYSLRALAHYAPWVRRVHIVSNCKAPDWLELDDALVNWVPHEEIFEERHLPTFSSHAIETRLHRIKGLSNHFVYSNDDFLLTRPTSKGDFFESNGLCKLKLESWGNVNGEPTIGEPDYLNGARTSQALIVRDFDVSPTQLHCHAPQALRVDILAEMAERYPEAFEVTACAKFRQVTDVAVTGFFFHHYAYVTGRAIKESSPTMLIQHNHNYRRKYSELLDERENPILAERHLSVCVNDGMDSHLNARWNNATEKFLGTYFHQKSKFDR